MGRYCAPVKPLLRVWLRNYFIVFAGAIKSGSNLAADAIATGSAERDE